jgi:GAF domain-containing protein
MYDPEVVDRFIGLQRHAPWAEPDEAPRAALRVHVARADSTPATAAPVAVATDERADDLLALRTLADVLPRDTRDVDAVLLIAAHLRTLFPLSLAAFYAHDREHDEVVLRYGWGHGAQALIGHRLPLGAGLSGWVAVNRQVIVNSEAALDLGERVSVVTPGLATCLSMPLMAGETADTLIGVLSLYSAAPRASARSTDAWRNSPRPTSRASWNRTSPPPLPGLRSGPEV